MATVRLAVGKLDNVHDPIALGAVGEGRVVSTLVEAVNVDIDDVWIASRRDGRTRRLTVTAPHSAHLNPFKQDAYFVAGGVLKRFNADLTSTPVATLSNNLPCGYEIINGESVVSNGVDIAWLSGTDYEDFSLSAQADDPDYEHYATMFPGRFLAFWNSLLWVANGNILGFSLPNNATTRDTRFCRIPMDGTIRMLGAVEDGLWLSTEKHVSFITGSGPDDLRFRHVSDKVPAHGCFFAGYEEREGGASRIVSWSSEDGFCEGRASGAYRNVSGGNVALPNGSTGVLAKKEFNGISQYIAIINGATDGNKFVADSLTINTHNI